MGDRTRIQFVDTLRFIASSFVLVQHFGEMGTALERSFVDIFSPGVFGVVLFFLLSGFVISSARNRSFDFRTFLIKRFFRIYPLYAACLIIIFVIIFLVPHNGFFKIDRMNDVLLNIVLIPEYMGRPLILGVAWTLSLEFAWYGLFALLLACWGEDFDRKAFVTASLIILALTITSLIGHFRLPIGRIGMIDAALFGCTAYRFYTRKIAVFDFICYFVSFILVNFIANFVAFGIFSHPNFTPNEVIVPWIEAILLFSFFVFYFGRIRPDADTPPLLNFLGRVSYSTYLLHPFFYSRLCGSKAKI